MTTTSPTQFRVDELSDGFHIMDLARGHFLPMSFDSLDEAVATACWWFDGTIGG